MIFEDHISALNTEIQDHEEAIKTYRARVSLERQKGELAGFSTALAEFAIPFHQSLIERKRKIIPQIIKANQVAATDLRALGIKTSGRSPKAILAELYAAQAMTDDEYATTYGPVRPQDVARRAQTALESTIAISDARGVAGDQKEAPGGETVNDPFLAILEEVFPGGSVEYLQ